MTEKLNVELELHVDYFFNDIFLVQKKEFKINSKTALAAISQSDMQINFFFGMFKSPRIGSSCL